MTYTIVNADSGLTFSKTSGIAANSSVTVTVPKNTSTVEGNTISKTFEVQTQDSLGEKSSSNKTVTINVKAIVRTSQPTISYPTTGSTSVPRVFTMTWSAYATYSADS